MSPNVDTLVMDHEQAAKDLLGRVEVDAVPVSYVLVVFHVHRGLLIVPNERAWLGQAAWVRPVFLLLFHEFGMRTFIYVKGD